MTRSRIFLRIVYSYFKADPFVETNGLTTWATCSTRPSLLYSFPHTISAPTALLNSGLALRGFTEYRHDISDTFAFWRSIKCCLCPIRCWRRNRGIPEERASRDHALYFDAVYRLVKCAELFSRLSIFVQYVRDVLTQKVIMPPLSPDESPGFLLAQVCLLHHAVAQAMLEALASIEDSRPGCTSARGGRVSRTASVAAPERDARHRHQDAAAHGKRLLGDSPSRRRRPARLSPTRLTLPKAVRAEMDATLRRLDEEAFAGFSTEERLPSAASCCKHAPI